MVQKRNILVEILLSLVTCGLYRYFAWIPRMDAEFKALAGETESQGGLSGIALGLVCMFTCNIYGIIWAYQTGAKYKEDSKVLWTILYFFIPIVAEALMQDELNKHAA